MHKRQLLPRFRCNHPSKEEDGGKMRDLGEIRAKQEQEQKKKKKDKKKKKRERERG